MGDEIKPCALPARAELRGERAESAHLTESVGHYHDRASHREDVLQEIGDHDAPEPGDRGLGQGDQHDRHQRPEPIIARQAL